MTSWRKDVYHGCWGKHAHIPDNDYWGICLFHVVWTNFFLRLFLCGTHGTYIYIFSSTEHCGRAIISPKEFKSCVHMHIICITVLENRIICCQIFCDLLLKSAFERIFNVMQLILVKIKWKYWIKKFHDICLSYYFNTSLTQVVRFSWQFYVSYQHIKLSRKSVRKKNCFLNVNFVQCFNMWEIE
jgi:hypothetical protein